MSMTYDEMIAVIQAHQEGKIIQWRVNTASGPKWLEEGEPAFNFASFTYRVKPEPPKPREFCLQVGKDGRVSEGHLIDDERPYHTQFQMVHVREVLDAPSVPSA